MKILKYQNGSLIYKKARELGYTDEQITKVLNDAKKAGLYKEGDEYNPGFWQNVMRVGKRYGYDTSRLLSNLSKKVSIPSNTNRNTVKELLLLLWDSGAFRDVKKNGREITYSQAVDGKMGPLTREAIQNSNLTNIKTPNNVVQTNTQNVAPEKVVLFSNPLDLYVNNISTETLIPAIKLLSPSGKRQVQKYLTEIKKKNRYIPGLFEGWTLEEVNKYFSELNPEALHYMMNENIYRNSYNHANRSTLQKVYNAVRNAAVKRKELEGPDLFDKARIILKGPSNTGEDAVHYAYGRSNNNYVIVNKENGTMTIYNRMNPVRLIRVAIGKKKGDGDVDLRVTGYSGTSYTTPSGPFQIMARDFSNYVGREPRLDLHPSDKKMSKGLIIANHSLPSIDSARDFLSDGTLRKSMGCIRGNCGEVGSIYNEGLVQNGTDVFIMPEVEGNEVVLEGFIPTVKYGSNNPTTYIGKDGKTYNYVYHK